MYNNHGVFFFSSLGTNLLVTFIQEDLLWVCLLETNSVITPCRVNIILAEFKHLPFFFLIFVYISVLQLVICFVYQSELHDLKLILTPVSLIAPSYN